MGKKTSVADPATEFEAAIMELLALKGTAREPTDEQAMRIVMAFMNLHIGMSRKIDAIAKRYGA